MFKNIYESVFLFADEWMDKINMSTYHRFGGFTHQQDAIKLRIVQLLLYNHKEFCSCFVCCPWAIMIYFVPATVKKQITVSAKHSLKRMKKLHTRDQDGWYSSFLVRRSENWSFFEEGRPRPAISLQPNSYPLSQSPYAHDPHNSMILLSRWLL